MAHFSRREFLKTGLAAGTLAASGSLSLIAQRGSATDMVTLGRSGVKVTRLAFGTGTISGRVQRDLGQDGFTRLVRHAYDRGIRFFETAESYGEMHKMLGSALKGIPRDSYQLMSKVTTRDGVNPQQSLTSSAASQRRNISTSCCSTGSTPRHGQPTRRAGRTRSSRSSRGKSCSVMARRFTDCRPCAGFPQTTGSRSR